jgi:aconitate decarboxylase
MRSESLTARVCERIFANGRTTIAGHVRQSAMQLLLDGIAVGVAGARIEAAPGILAAYFADQGGKPTATLLGLGGMRLATVPAAVVNASAMHVLDFEPMWLPSTHALSPALAPALALGEALGCSGNKILTALILGIEIQGWLREAGGHVHSGDMKFHPPGFVGPIGAAVAAAHLLDFEPMQIANAIGIATSRCGGLFTNLGTMTKSSHCAYAAAAGLEAALLTERGFTGSLSAFDPARQSYAEAFFPAGFDGAALENFGAPFRIENPGFAIKLFPAKFSTHYAITAALDARKRIGSADAIHLVRMVAADVPSSDRPNPRTGLDGKFSLQYTAAVALLDGAVGLGSFSDERLQRQDMQELLPKMQVRLSREMSSKYTEGRYLDIEIELTDGKIVLERCESPRGSWGAPPILPSEHLAKVRDCLATGLAPQDINTCIALAQSFDDLDAGGVAHLLRLANAADR